jgi:hypothetical protein
MGAASYIGRIGGLAVASAWAPPSSPDRARRTPPPTAAPKAADHRRAAAQGLAARRAVTKPGPTPARQPTTPATPRTRIPGPPKPTDAIEPLQRRPVPSGRQRLFDDCQMLPTRLRSGWPTRFMARAMQPTASRSRRQEPSGQVDRHHRPSGPPSAHRLLVPQTPTTPPIQATS